MLSRQALLRTARAAAPSRAMASQARFFAAPAANEAVKPPVALFGLDGTYATALVRHAVNRSPAAAAAAAPLLAPSRRLSKVSTKEEEDVPREGYAKD